MGILSDDSPDTGWVHDRGTVRVSVHDYGRSSTVGGELQCRATSDLLCRQLQCRTRDSLPGGASSGRADRRHQPARSIQPSFRRFGPDLSDIHEVFRRVRPRLCRPIAGPETIARISHRWSAAAPDTSAITALRLVGRLNVRSSTPAAPSRRAPCPGGVYDASRRQPVRKAG